MKRPEIADRPTRGILLKLASVMFFTAMVLCIKTTSDDVPPGQAVFFRSFFAIPVILVWLAWTGDLREGLTTTRLPGHLWRGVIGTGAMYMGFTALGFLPLPEATAIGFAAPIITVILAAIFLGERIRLYRIAAVLAGLIGVVLILIPSFSLSPGEALATGATFGAIAALVSATMRATALIFTRRLVTNEHTATIVFYFSSIAAVLGLLSLPFGWAMPDTVSLALLVASGIFGGFGQIFLTNSYRFAQAGVIAPFDYTMMITALIAGYFLFDEAPTAIVLGGAALVIAAGIFIVLRERALGLKRGRARSVTPTQG